MPLVLRHAAQTIGAATHPHVAHSSRPACNLSPLTAAVRTQFSPSQFSAYGISSPWNPSPHPPARIPAPLRPPRAASGAEAGEPSNPDAAAAAASEPAPAASSGEGQGEGEGLGQGEGGVWSPSFIRQLVAQEEEEEEEALADAMTSDFMADPEGLFDYMDRAYAEGPRHVATPINLLLEEASGAPVMGVSAAVANDIVGMGTWRLKDMVDPVIEFLVSRIEGSWRELLDTDLCLYPKEWWKDLGLDLCDSEDPYSELNGFSYADIPSPQKGAKGYPRLLLENRVYTSRVFRKLHLEVGHRQDGLQVLHVVAYPRYSYDLPIFGLDIVVAAGRVTLAVVDCCPVRAGLKLPQHYMQTMALLQQTFLSDTDSSSRRIPDWGAASFSPLAVCITPSGPDELAAFCRYAVALHRAHLEIALRTGPVLAGPGERRAAARLAEIAEGQKRFCDQQLSNKKTRRVLEVAFGEEWADAYMRELMFDWDPTYEPPFEDVSWERMYTYFDENPEFGDLAAEAEALELGAEADRATESLQAAASGRPVPQDKLQMAMSFMYENDPTFRAAVQGLTGQEEVSPEQLLSKELLDMLISPGKAIKEKAS